MARPEWIEVGRVSRAHGVHGEVRVRPDSDNPERFAPGSVLHARPARAGVAGPRRPEQVRLTIEEVRGGDDFPIVAFREVGDREAAEGLRGYLLEVRSADLPKRWTTTSSIPSTWKVWKCGTHGGCRSAG